MSEYWDKRRKEEEKENNSPKCPQCSSKFVYILVDGILNCRKCGYRGKQKDEI